MAKPGRGTRTVCTVTQNLNSCIPKKPGRSIGEVISQQLLKWCGCNSVEKLGKGDENKKRIYASAEYQKNAEITLNVLQDQKESHEPWVQQ